MKISSGIPAFLQWEDKKQVGTRRLVGQRSRRTEISISFAHSMSPATAAAISASKHSLNFHSMPFCVSSRMLRPFKSKYALLRLDLRMASAEVEAAAVFDGLLLPRCQVRSHVLISLTDALEGGMVWMKRL